MYYMPATILNTRNAAVLKRDGVNSYGVYILVGMILYCIFISKVYYGFSFLNQTSRQEVDCSTPRYNYFSKAISEIEVYY